MGLENKIAHFFSGKNRARKFKIFCETIHPQANDLILDVGASDEEYSACDNLLEKNYPYSEKITALSINSISKLKARYPKITCVLYDGRKFPFEDERFNICWSNAVIEHVGVYEKQLYFLKEIKRVAKRAFITTPNQCFPVEVHTRIPFMHWLPKPIFNRICCLSGKKWAAGDYMHLLDKKMIIKLLKDANIKKFEIKHNRLLGITLDFVIII